MFRVKADKPDARDFKYAVDYSENLPVRIDLRPWCSAVEDQLHLGSCVGQAIVGAFELMINRLYPDKFIDLSRLYVYYNARLYEGGYYLDQDVGAYVRDGIKSVNKWGVCSELLWPYIIDRFDDSPSLESYEDGERRIIKKYYRVNDVKDMTYALNKFYPVVISMNVYNSFYDLDQQDVRVLPMPTAKEEIIGGHAVTLVGYDLDRQQFIARNSFGEDWGDRGYFWIPFDYVNKDIMDCWIFDIELNG